MHKTGPPIAMRALKGYVNENAIDNQGFDFIAGGATSGGHTT